MAALPHIILRNRFTKLSIEQILSQIIIVDIGPFRGLISKSRGGNARMVGAFPWEDAFLVLAPRKACSLVFYKSRVEIYLASVFLLCCNLYSYLSTINEFILQII